MSLPGLAAQPTAAGQSARWERSGSLLAECDREMVPQLSDFLGELAVAGQGKFKAAAGGLVGRSL